MVRLAAAVGRRRHRRRPGDRRRPVTVDGAPAVTGQATERLPDGLVAPCLTTPNLTEKAADRAAVQRVLVASFAADGWRW